MGFLTRCKRPFLFAVLLQFCNMLFSFFLKTFLILFEKQHQIQHGMMLYIHKKTVEFMPQSGFGSQSAGRYSRCVKCHLHCKTLSFHSAAGAFRAVCSLISIVVRASVVVNITKFRFLVRSLCNCCSIQRRCRLLTKIRPCLSAWAQKK